MLQLKEKRMRKIWNYDHVIIFSFFPSFWIFFPILSENRNSIWDPFWCVCFTVSLSLALSQSFWDNAGLHSNLFSLEMRNFIAAFPIRLFLSVPVPGDTSLRMAALICRKTSWEYWFSKSALFSPWKKKKKKKKKLSTMWKPVAFN